jgi:hypothetical protein
MHDLLLEGSDAAPANKLYVARATYALKVMTDHYRLSADWALRLLEAGPGRDRDLLVDEMHVVALPECAA